MKCIHKTGEHKDSMYEQMVFKANDEHLADCSWTLEFKKDNGEFLKFHFNVKKIVGCPACALGEKHKSTTDCGCERIQTHPAEGQLFTAHDYGANTDHHIELSSHDMVTFRQFTTKAWKFDYVPNLADMKCIHKTGEHKDSTGMYEQMVFKANEEHGADCSWTLEFKNDNGNFLKFHFNVKKIVGCPACPLGEKHKADCACEAIQTLPTAGQLFLAHHLGANTDHHIELSSHDMVTFRQFTT